jgi:hypothetical protein
LPLLNLQIFLHPRPISALQLRCRAWYGSLGIIPGPKWKMSCNNLLLYQYFLNITKIWNKLSYGNPWFNIYFCPKILSFWFGLVWFMVFNVTFNNISVILWRKKPEYLEKTTDLSQVTDKLYS